MPGKIHILLTGMLCCAMALTPSASVACCPAGGYSTGEFSSCGNSCCEGLDAIPNQPSLGMILCSPSGPLPCSGATPCGTPGACRACNCAQDGGANQCGTYPSCTACCTAGWGAWAAYGTGYQRRQYTNASCAVTNTEYQCAANYYGSSTNGTSGCAACPGGGASAAGSTSATQCYITAGGSDGTGSYNWQGGICYYSL